MEALRRSLDQVSAGKKKTAKADAEAAKKVTNIKAAQEQRGEETQGFVRTTPHPRRRLEAD